MDQLSRALKSTLNAQMVKIKLTKRQGAYLSVEVVQVCDSMCHLMKVTVISEAHVHHKDWSNGPCTHNYTM